MINGFINLRKPPQITSNRALSILKTALKQNNIITKVGHLGTLDPIAEGVLPVALGRATRLFNYTLDKKKVYEAVFEFGYITDTLDNTGEITGTTDKIPDIDEITKILSFLIAETEQIPPIYSAKSVNGVKAYKRARKGEIFDLKAKKITIYDLKLLEKIDDRSFKFLIVCSGGTYIRAIARDMAKQLGSLAVMTKLNRTASGSFNIDNATDLSVLESSTDLHNYILPMETVLDGMEKLDLDESTVRRLLDGVDYNYASVLPKSQFKIYSNEKLIAIGQSDNGQTIKINTWLL